MEILLLVWQHVLGTGRTGGECIPVEIVLFVFLGGEEIQRGILDIRDVFFIVQGIEGSAAGLADLALESLRCRRRQEESGW